MKLALDTRFFTQRTIEESLSKGEVYDPPLVRAICGPLQAGDTMLDVGAHVGYFAALAADRVGQDGQVFAFEPHPETFAMLARNAAEGHFYGVNCAIGRRREYRYLTLNLQDEGMSSITNVKPNMPQVPVRVERLDDLRELYRWRSVRMMKLDVEGGELDVLRGAEKLLQDADNVVFEHNRMHGIVPTDMECRALLSEYGFKFYLIRQWKPDANGWHEGEWIRPIGADEPLPLLYANILASKDERIQDTIKAFA